MDVITVPDTLQEATDPRWLERALAPVSGGDRIVSVELTELVKTMASKVRIKVCFARDPDTPQHYCLKSFLGFDVDPTTIREARFYQEIAPHITMRTPGFKGAVIDEERNRGLLIMDDLIEAGAHFCSALEPLGPDEAAASLDQIARLHAASHLLPTLSWLPTRIDTLVAGHHYPVEDVQSLLDDPRGLALDERTRSAHRLYDGMAKLSQWAADRPRTLLHGDCHAGNLYMTADGPGFTDWQLVQRGLWAFDVAYHICAILPVEVAEREERALLGHYLDSLDRHGGAAPDPEAAWEAYRRAQIYGFYHWAITRRVDPPITHEFTKRLGAGVMRHDSYRLLGL